MGRKKHIQQAPKAIKIGIITISSSRSEKTDKSGQWMKRLAEKEGHAVVFYEIVKDDRHAIAHMVATAIEQQEPHVLLLTGGTGISGSDVTIEAVRPLFAKELTAFGVIFAQLSFRQIDSAAILSRASAGVIGNTTVFCMPGSKNACKLACIELIFPEIEHIAAHVAQNA